MTASTPSRAKARNRPFWRRPLPLSVMAFIVVLIVAGLLPKPIEVDIEKASRGALQVSVVEEGKTRVRERYVVAMPVSGLLRRVDWEPGDRVAAGKTVLAEIVPQASAFLDPRAQAEAEARVNAAQAAVRQREADLERVRSTAELAQKELKRGAELQKTGAISTREWDTVQNEATTQERALKGAEFALRIAQFEFEQSKAALVAPVNDGGPVEPLRLISPVDGVVLNRYEESSRPLVAGSPVLEVGDPAALEVEIELLSQDAVGVAKGAEVWIEQWGGGEALKARVRTVEPAAFTKVSALGVEEQRVRVIADFEVPREAYGKLGDRYRVEARVVTWSAQDVLQVPAGALFRRGNEWSTFVVRGGKARRVSVQAGKNSGDAAEVLGGLSVGDPVIVHPPDVLVEGMAVKARK